MNFKIRQSVTPHEEGWWDWAVWLDASAHELNKVDYVEYFLHPTFPNPVQKVSTRETNFRLNARGWGEFKINVRIYLDDDDEVIKLEHWLELDDIAPTRAGESLLEPVRYHGESSDKPLIFISSAMTDMKFTYTLKNALEEEGLEVLMGQDLDDDRPLEMMLQTERRSIQAGLFVVSDIYNPSLKRDYSAIHKYEISSLVVEVGGGHDLPDDLRNVQRFRLSGYSASETRQVAENIARQVRSQI